MAQVVRVPRQRRRWPLIAAGVAIGLLFVLGGLTGFYVDLLWFSEDARLSSVFASVFWTRALLVAVFGAVFFVLMYANLLVVRRLSPRYRLFSPEQEVIDRWRGTFDPYMRWILPGISLLFALFAAAGIAGFWQRFLLWRHGAGVQFGSVDPIFERDLSFYVFRLPFLHFVQSWLFSSLVVVTIVVAAAYYLWGGIRFQAIGEKVTPTVKAHLSVLLGLIVLVKAWGYRLGQFDLLTAEHDVVSTGASFTDVNARLPALRILVPIAIVCAVLFLINIRFRGWALPAMGLGLLALASIVAGAAYPAFVQKFRVEPQELQRESPYIQENMDASREAYGLTGIAERAFRVSRDVEPEDIEANPATISNIRLWDPETLRRAVAQLQQIRPYYSFNDVDVDRYEVEPGVRRVVMISAREIDEGGIPEGRRSWQNLHLYFTHGFGYVATRVDRVTSEGQPDFVVRDLPPDAPSADLRVEDPPGARIYFGETVEDAAAFKVVRTAQDELDRPLAEGERTTNYGGDGGVEVGGLFRRLAFAWHFRDVNLLISDLIDSESRMLYNRDIRARVEKIAPFLLFDGDPYLAVADGRLVWIQDAYTHTDQYPYSARLDLGEVSNLEGRANYLRNSVKITIDAYDGAMRFYVVDPSDPVIRVWQRAFPDLFTSESEVSAELAAHFRYPEDLFKVQANQYAQYHVDTPTEFFSGQDFWAIPNNPGTAEGEPLQPYYVLMRLPGEDEEEFVLFVPFTPNNRPNMIAWFAAKSDPDEYGELTTYQFQTGENVQGPEQVFRRINQDTEVSEQRTLLGQGGSRVVFGNLLAIPVEDSFLYVQPMYLEASENGLPELKRVIIVHGETVTIEETLQEALDASFGEGEDDEEPPPDETETVASLIEQALQHFSLARQALRDGELEEYARQVALAEEAIRAAAEASGQPPPEESPPPEPTGSPPGGG